MTITDGTEQDKSLEATTETEAGNRSFPKRFVEALMTRLDNFLSDPGTVRTLLYTANAHNGLELGYYDPDLIYDLLNPQKPLDVDAGDDY